MRQEFNGGVHQRPRHHLDVEGLQVRTIGTSHYQMKEASAMLQSVADGLMVYTVAQVWPSTYCCLTSRSHKGLQELPNGIELLIVAAAAIHNSQFLSGSFWLRDVVDAVMLGTPKEKGSLTSTMGQCSFACTYKLKAQAGSWRQENCMCHGTLLVWSFFSLQGFGLRTNQNSRREKCHGSTCEWLWACVAVR